MQRKFYLDTSIWRDYFEDRNDGIRPLGEFAFQFLKECSKRKIAIIISEFVVYELQNEYSQKEIDELIESFREIIHYVKPTPHQQFESKQLAKQYPKSHWQDIFHAIIARDNQATMITRDKGFEELTAIVESKKPEEVIFD